MVEPMENQFSEVFECEGLNGGALFHCGDGYFYAKYANSGNNSYLRCKIRSCRGGAKLVMVDGSRRLHHLTGHSEGCLPEFLFEETIALRKKILGRCQSERTPLTTIFREECNRVLPAVAATVTLPQVLSSMKRARRKGTPRIPDSYAMYEELLHGRFQDSEGTQYFFKRIGQDGSEAVCFIIDPIKEVLINTTEIHIDGTFKIVPSVPESRQLLTILAVKHDYTFPVAFALMKTKNGTAYSTVLSFIKSKCDGLNPEIIISDFENGLKSAVKEVFPDAIHKGCWFHFTQAIFRRVQRNRQLQQYYDNPELRRAVRMLMCLALLPEYQIEVGYDYIKRFCEDQNLTQDMDELLTYFTSQWMEKVGVASFSVYGQPRRTNNCQESFHHALNSMIGKPHPNIWEFTDALIEVASASVRDHLRMETRGVPITLRRKRRWVLQDREILRAQDNLVLGRVTPAEFLRQMSHHISYHVPLETVVDDIDEDLAPLPVALRVHTVPPENPDIHEDGAILNDPNESSNRGRRRGGRRGGRVGRGQGHGRGVQGRGRRTRGPVASADEEAYEFVDVPNHEGAGAQLPVPQAEVAHPYHNYRIVPTVALEDTFMSNDNIVCQQREILQSLEGTQEPSEATDDSFHCSLCLTNRPTRVCLPCGHIVMCRSCAQEFVMGEQFHTVIVPDGSLMETHIRLPYVCPHCRALVGSIQKVVLPH